jgi:hypothetical protein
MEVRGSDGARLGRAGARHGTYAPIGDASPADVLAEELAFSQGILVYPFPLVRLLALSGFGIRFPVTLALRLASPLRGSPRETHFFLSPNLRPKNETMVTAGL